MNTYKVTINTLSEEGRPIIEEVHISADGVSLQPSGQLMFLNKSSVLSKGGAQHEPIRAFNTGRWLDFEKTGERGGNLLS